MHDPIEGFLVGYLLRFANYLHQMEGKGAHSAGNEGNSIEHSTVSQCCLLSDGLPGKRLRAVEIPKALIPTFGICEGKIENPLGSLLDLMTNIPTEEIDFIEEIQR